MSDYVHPSLKQENNTLVISGAWLTPHLANDNLSNLPRSPLATDNLTIDCTQITALDTNGALLLSRYFQILSAQHITYVLTGLDERYQHLLDLIDSNPVVSVPSKQNLLTFIPRVGGAALLAKSQILRFIAFLGEISLGLWTWVQHPRQIRWRAMCHAVDATGYQAMAIVSLLSFLIGVVLCYQMGMQLDQYGASIYVVDLLGISILREFAPLLTAIIVAGRTGSSFAAQIGTMKLNQEIDALQTMGLSPVNLLVLPKLTGLMIALPLLSVLSMFTGIIGGMFMAKWLFSISYLDFITRFGSVISLKMLVLGLIKTPIFAIFIAAIGCFQGFQVSHSAQSVGERTTTSVVQGIFMIIVIDALFSIIYSKLGL